MSEDTKRVRVRLTPFIVGERPHVFVNDTIANRRFLEGIDADYWTYQAAAHADRLDAEEREQRQRAAAALRVAYSQGVETLLALIGAFLQVPRYPLGWLVRYNNADLRYWRILGVGRTDLTRRRRPSV